MWVESLIYYAYVTENPITRSNSKPVIHITQTYFLEIHSNIFLGLPTSTLAFIFRMWECFENVYM